MAVDFFGLYQGLFRMADQDNNFRWLHISDMHFKIPTSVDQSVVTDALLRSIPGIVSRYGSFDVIFVTGDVAFSGRREEYQAASVFFDALLHATNLNKDRLFVIPGNHDIDRTAASGLSRSIKDEKESMTYFGGRDSLIHVEKKLKNFIDWHKIYFGDERDFLPKSVCIAPHVLNVRSNKISICGFNSAIFCLDDEDFGKLWIGRSSLDKTSINTLDHDISLRIALMHHPTNWLSELERPNIEAFLSDNFDCLLFGHLHQNETKQISDDRSTTSLLSAGALYQTRQYPNRILIGRFSESRINIIPYHYVDAPREAWALDTSLYFDSADYSHTFQVKTEIKSHESTSSSGPTIGRNSLDSTMDAAAGDKSGDAKQIKSILNTKANTFDVDSAKSDFESSLFANQLGQRAYVEPRLMPYPLGVENQADENFASIVDISNLTSSDLSYLICVRPEHGGSTLAKRLVLSLAMENKYLPILRDARVLPNYKARLAKELYDNLNNEPLPLAIIVDNADFERDEKLMKELLSSGKFKKIIIIAMDRAYKNNELIKYSDIFSKFTILYLWPMNRSDIRELSNIVFCTDDATFISPIVEKVYRDLLSLCIPLVPPTVIMYLKVLCHEGQFNPLNRVDILGSYITVALRRPSDVDTTTFGIKNKLDVISSFAYDLYSDKLSCFDNFYWTSKTLNYKIRSLIDFNEDILINELCEARIFTRNGNNYYFRYQFFFVYFLGYYFANHRDEMNFFLESEGYLHNVSTIDVISSLSNDNDRMISTISFNLGKHMEAYFTKYIGREFEPLDFLPWIQNVSKDSEFWKSISREIKSPITTRELDIIKSSLLEEHRTAHQEIEFSLFREIESAIFGNSQALTDVLKNSDSASGEKKLEAYDKIRKVHEYILKTGVLIADKLSMHKFFTWGGIHFVGFDVPDAINSQDVSLRIYAAIKVIVDLGVSIPIHFGQRIGISKLGAVFRESSKNTSNTGFDDLLAFSCLTFAFPPNWEADAERIIRKTQVNSYYLYVMQVLVTRIMRYDIVSTRDRSIAKRLVALIAAKRMTKKISPGNKAVNTILRSIEECGNFDDQLNEDDL